MGKDPINKKVLDVLKNELDTVKEDENSQLTGGFAGATAEMGVPIDDINVPCNNKSCTSNNVAGCGATPTTS